MHSRVTHVLKIPCFVILKKICFITFFLQVSNFNIFCDFCNSHVCIFLLLSSVWHLPSFYKRVLQCFWYLCVSKNALFIDSKLDRYMEIYLSVSGCRTAAVPFPKAILKHLTNIRNICLDFWFVDVKKSVSTFDFFLRLGYF